MLAWNHFLFSLALGDFHSRTLIIAAPSFIGEEVTDLGALMAAQR